MAFPFFARDQCSRPTVYLLDLTLLSAGLLEEHRDLTALVNFSTLALGVGVRLRVSSRPFLVRSETCGLRGSM